MIKVWESAIGQLLALIAFFAFPALQYWWLRRVTADEGTMNLSFSYTYGFRLAVTNQFGKRVISDLRWQARLRRLVPSPDNPRLNLADDTELPARSDFFLFPGRDEILVAFRLEREDERVVLVATSLLGEKRSSAAVQGECLLVCDFTANIENPLNFDFKVAKRATIDLRQLLMACAYEREMQGFVPTDQRLWTKEPVITIIDVT
jgi:hypothetical protein